VTLGFHTFIASHLPFASVQEWNIFCGWASLVFFGMHPFEWPAGGVHPALAAGLALALVIVPLVGQILPSRVPFLFAFRPYAGNWFFAWHVVSASGQAKLRQLKTAESLFFEENDPESSLAKSASPPLTQSPRTPLTFRRSALPSVCCRHVAQEARGRARVASRQGVPPAIRPVGPRGTARAVPAVQTSRAHRRAD